MTDIIMSLIKIASPVEIPDKLQEIASLALETLEKYRKKETDENNTHVLDEIDITGKKIAEKKVGDAIIVEKLSHYMNLYAHAVKPDSEIFPAEFKKAFTEEFLSMTPLRRMYQDEIRETIWLWFEKLEDALRTQYSSGERMILRHEILRHIDIGEIKRHMKEMETQHHEDMDEIKRGQREIMNHLSGNQPTEMLKTDNRDYKKAFEEPLFLHNGKSGREKNGKVNLSNLFVSQRFEVKRGDDKLSGETLNAYLARFVQTDTRFLFIEGDSGCGKTGLTEYLSYHYEKRDEISEKIFGNTQLITIRLRNLDIPTDTSKAEERLTLAILRFLYDGKGKDRDNIRRFRKLESRILLLDGYDEVCAIEGIRDYQSVLWQLQNLDCKIIVTTRPNYIRLDEADKHKLYWCIALQHFNVEQRQIWLES